MGREAADVSGGEDRLRPDDEGQGEAQALEQHGLELSLEGFERSGDE
jgi:hypothetical protein